MIMSNSTYNQLTANLELLKLTQMKLHLDEIRDFVTTNGLSFTEGLLKLSSYEVDFKEQNASRSMIKAAAFPFVKELKDYDFEFQPSVNEQEMMELAHWLHHKAHTIGYPPQYIPNRTPSDAQP